ncbi:MAG: hypothetical protein V3U45_01165 [bacterium]
MEQTENEKTDEDDEDHIRLYIDSRLMHKIQALVDAPELGFSSVPHFLRASLYSFVAYQQKTLKARRGEPPW